MLFRCCCDDDGLQQGLMLALKGKAYEFGTYEKKAILIFVAAVVSYSVGRGKWVGFELLRGSEVLALVAEEASASDISARFCN